MRIRREDVEAVRERSRIDEVISEHVSLRPAGIGSLKGLCPFHDEKSPSFNVRPTVGFYHCFGCQKGGDVISFVQEIDHLSFAEAVERLAARIGMELRYEDDDGKDGKRPGRGDVNLRRRLLEANRAAAQYFAEQLGTSPDASIGRQFLVDRGFDQAAAELFGVGFAPRGGEVLTRHLLGRGFTAEELVAAGLAGQGRRGLYDRFRGRLIWPIRDVTGDTLGFGARRLYDDDTIEAKYLNTPETALYKKSHVLYGVDLAKREIAKSHQVVVVEGYTDVMACHLAGEPTAVATCGTAFAADHIRIVRRLIGDERNSGGRVIFTFDGDAAGQKAALKAFEDDQRFVSQTYVSIAPSGMDPCELRQRQGNEAVKELIAGRRPMFEFKIQSIIEDVDLTTVEGGARALRLAAPVVAGIRDEVIRRGYLVKLAGMLGMDDDLVRQAVVRAQRDLRASGGQAGPGRRPDGERQPGGEAQRGGDDRRGGNRRGAGPAGGVQQPDGSWLMPDGSYILPPPEPSRGGWKGKGGKGGGNWGERDRKRWNNGEGKTAPGTNFPGGYGAGPSWSDHEPPPDDMPPPPDDEPPHDAYDHAPASGGAGPTAQAPRRYQPPKLERPDPRNRIAAVEREALECMLQVPRLVPSLESDALPDDTFQTPLYRVIHEAIRGAGGIAVAVGMTPSAWVALVQDFAPDPVVPMITELAVAPLPSTDDDLALARYAAGMILHIAEEQVRRELAGLTAAWQRGEDVGLRVLELETLKRTLSERKHGAT
ncbi:DNA primase [Kineosporia sp. J2-2]|uniref:DNA primase n=1 Tax=Kineosporia corallincola TaxID=2835133 RepID=A0ABS5TJ49_9ACTN|nr:DNA primase [Kineosporia corallincola]MBT0770858.1 DNA primase [Kineosporia corallincola]